MIGKQLKTTVTNHVFESVVSISKESGISMSQTVENLIEYALTYLDDDYLSDLADEAEKRSVGKKSIPAGDLWKKLGI